MHRPFFLQKKRPSRRKTSLSAPVDWRAIAGVTLIEAVCVRETVEPEYSVSGPSGSWTAAESADGFHEGMDMGCSRIRKDRLDNLAQQDRDDLTPATTACQYEYR